MKHVIFYSRDEQINEAPHPPPLLASRSPEARAIWVAVNGRLAEGADGRHSAPLWHRWHRGTSPARWIQESAA